LIHTFLDLKQLFLIFPLNFPNGVIIFTLVYIGRAKKKKNRIHETKLQVWPIYGSTVTFMAFKLKLMAFPIKLTPNDPNQGKKIMKFWNFGFWTLGLAFKIFFALFSFFLRSLMLKKSSGMQEPYMWVVFHPYQIANQNSHSSSLWVRKNSTTYKESIAKIFNHKSTGKLDG
jgi:hypothetical protein